MQKDSILPGENADAPNKLLVKYTYNDVINERFNSATLKIESEDEWKNVQLDLLEGKKIEVIDFLERCVLDFNAEYLKSLLSINFLRGLKLRGVTFTATLDLAVSYLKKQQHLVMLKLWNVMDISQVSYKILMACPLSDSLIYLDIYDTQLEVEHAIQIGKALTTNTCLKKFEIGKVGVNLQTWPILLNIRYLRNFDATYLDAREDDLCFLLFNPYLRDCLKSKTQTFICKFAATHMETDPTLRRLFSDRPMESAVKDDTTNSS